MRGVCCFFGTFGSTNAHFFTAHADECESMKRSSEWTFEGTPFYVHPTRPDGSCPAGTGPIYRLYNGGQEGVPSHRLTPVRSERKRLIDLGWLPEGAGSEAVAFCVPISPGVAFARLQAFVASTWFLSWSWEGGAVATSLSFDAVVASGEDEYPYEAPVSTGGGYARWDPFSSRVVLFLTEMGGVNRIVFPSEGEDDDAACSYSWPRDGFYSGPLPPLDQLLYGPCEPVDADPWPKR